MSRESEKAMFAKQGTENQIRGTGRTTTGISKFNKELKIYLTDVDKTIRDNNIYLIPGYDKLQEYIFSTYETFASAGFKQIKKQIDKYGADNVYDSVLRVTKDQLKRDYNEFGDESTVHAFMEGAPGITDDKTKEQAIEFIVKSSIGTNTTEFKKMINRFTSSKKPVRGWF